MNKNKITANKSILIVDDEKGILEVCAGSLKSLSETAIVTKQNGHKAIQCIKENNFDLIILDLKMPEISGMEILKVVKKNQPNAEVIMMTAFPTIETAVESVKLGAYDYITKPFTPDQLRLVVYRALQKNNLKQDNRLLSHIVEKKYRMGRIIGESHSMQSVYELIEQLSPTDSEVLIVGESGTGKELVARCIHNKSPRSKNKFFPVNCSAIPDNLLESEFFGYEKGAFTGAQFSSPGFFEFTDEGTLFLDEVCELSPALQAKLLRVLQEKTVRRLGSKKEINIDVRIITATNRKIETEVASGRFREDLYYRLNVVKVSLPALKDRASDIPLLASHFLDTYNRQYKKNVTGFTSDVMEVFQCYSWPGNVRQLQNTIKRGVILSKEANILIDNLPEEIIIPSKNIKKDSKLGFFEKRKQKIIQFERQYLIEILKTNNGDVTVAAKQANIPRGTFYRLLKKHDISLEKSHHQS